MFNLFTPSNRANAQLSTGATTQASKAIVSQNAMKHGLTGKFKVLPCESQSEFDRLLVGFVRSEAPAGDDEIEMVHQMVEALCSRAVAFVCKMTVSSRSRPGRPRSSVPPRSPSRSIFVTHEANPRIVIVFAGLGLAAAKAL